ncbi:MAG TPA: glycosyltransferase [Acidimicrobiia bacterium]|nr:glycosyltransferase [Acidimicrobiia bacterium]
MQRVAMLSVHTSPLAQPGSGDAGGMNVSVHALASALARAGVGVDVLTRHEHPEQPPVVVVEPGYRVVHLDAGPCAPVPRHQFPELVAPFSEAARSQLERCGTDYDVLHANYWVSGAVGHRLKHELDLPLVATFHSLDRVRAEVGLDDEVTLRPRVEAEVVRCADLVVAATDDEREQLVKLYGADPDRIEIVPQGVDPTVFSPGDRAAARRALRLDDGPVLLFVGRIQPLKGVDLAIESLYRLSVPRATLLIVGGPSGPEGEAELQRAHQLVEELGLEAKVRFVPPQPHQSLATYYRASDVCIVPSRSESFGLVALEAAACGTPVVAANVGGLRFVVENGMTGYLVDGRDPGDFAALVDRILRDGAGSMPGRAVARAAGYRWDIAAARLRRQYDDLAVRAPVQCT